MPKCGGIDNSWAQQDSRFKSVKNEAINFIMKVLPPEENQAANEIVVYFCSNRFSRYLCRFLIIQYFINRLPMTISCADISDTLFEKPTHGCCHGKQLKMAICSETICETLIYYLLAFFRLFSFYYTCLFAYICIDSQL